MRYLNSGGLLLVTLLAIGGCAPDPATPALPDPDAVRASLIAADQAFAVATAERRLEGWVGAFDSTAIQMAPDEPFVAGIGAVRAAMTPVFADTSFTLSWQPTMAFASADGDLGYTLGTWRTTRFNDQGKGQVVTGKYVTIWRKQADGSWKVVFDGGNPDTEPRLHPAR